MRDRAAIVLLLGVFLAAVLVAAPWGAHPMNDDWTHLRPIADWLATGRFVYPAWLSAFMYVPIAVGMAAAKTFGFSFLLFRLLNVAAAAATLAVFFLTLRRADISAQAALLAAGLLGANPMFLLLATTAMGDITALFCLSLAAYCHVRMAVSDDARARDAWLAAGSAAFALAFFTRQIVGLYAVGMALAAAARPRPSEAARRIAALLLPVILVAAPLVLFRFPLPTQTASHLVPEGWSVTRHVLSQAWQSFLLGGFFALPVLPVVLARRPGAVLAPAFVASLLVGLLIPALALWKGKLIFGMGNLLTPYGLGPTTEVLQGTLPPLLGTEILGVLTVACFISAAVACRILWLGRRELLRSVRRWAFLWVYAALTGAVLLSVQSFDRYLLLLLPAPLVALAIALDVRPWSRPLAAVGVAAMLVVSVVGTHDAHAWQRARWALGERLLARGVPADAIEGGYEWDGWHLYGRERETLPEGYTPFWAPWWVAELFPGHPMTVILSFSELGGYRAVDREPIRAWAFPAAAVVANEVAPGTLR